MTLYFSGKLGADSLFLFFVFRQIMHVFALTIGTNCKKEYHAVSFLLRRKELSVRGKKPAQPLNQTVMPHSMLVA